MRTLPRRITAQAVGMPTIPGLRGLRLQIPPAAKVPKAAGSAHKKLVGPVAPAVTERRAVKDPSQQAGATPQPATTFMTTLGPNVSHIMNSSGYDVTKGLGARGGVLTYNDLNLQTEQMQTRKGVGSNGPSPPTQTGGSFVRQTIQAKAAHPNTKLNTLSQQRSTQAASPVELAPVPTTDNRRRPIRNAGSASPTTALRTPAEILADSVTQSTYFAALLATADKRRTDRKSVV